VDTIRDEQALTRSFRCPYTENRDRGEHPHQTHHPRRGRMRKSLGATGFLALLMIGLWVSPGYGDYGKLFSAGFKAGADVTVEGRA
jgi:hypothetical protein